MSRAILAAVFALAFASPTHAQLTDLQISDILGNLGKGDGSGVPMTEAFNLTCSGFRIDVWSPEAWVRHQGRRARKEMRPFGLSDVDQETRDGLWRIRAGASIPSKVKDMRASCSDSVSHVVVRNKAATVVVQPLSKEPIDQTAGNAMGATFPFTGLDTRFRDDEILELWGQKRDQPFWISVIGVKGWKYDFEVKPKHFQHLK